MPARSHTASKRAAARKPAAKGLAASHARGELRKSATVTEQQAAEIFARVERGLEVAEERTDRLMRHYGF